MITFDNDYTVILEKAKFFVSLYKSKCSPEDAISSTYIALFENPEYKYEYFSFEKKLLFFCKYFNANDPVFVSYNDSIKSTSDRSNGKFSHVTHYFKLDQTCRVCNEVKYANQFQIKENKIGKKAQRRICIECYTAWRKQYNIDNKEKGRLQKQNRKLSNLELVLKQHRDSNNKRTKYLTDDYVMMSLSRKYSRDYLINNPEIVEAQRQSLIAKRAKKHTNKPRHL